MERPQRRRSWKTLLTRNLMPHLRMARRSHIQGRRGRDTMCGSTQWHPTKVRAAYSHPPLNKTKKGVFSLGTCPVFERMREVETLISSLGIRAAQGRWAIDFGREAAKSVD